VVGGGRAGWYKALTGRVLGSMGKRVERGFGFDKKNFPEKRIGRRSGTGLDWTGVCISSGGSRTTTAATDCTVVRVSRGCVWCSDRLRARAPPPYDLTGACGVSGRGRNAHVVDAPRTAD